MTKLSKRKPTALASADARRAYTDGRQPANTLFPTNNQNIGGEHVA